MLRMGNHILLSLLLTCLARGAEHELSPGETTAPALLLPKESVLYKISLLDNVASVLVFDVFSLESSARPTLCLSSVSD